MNTSSRPIARLGATPRTGTDGGYPWEDGELLYANDLNAAVSPLYGGSTLGPINSINTSMNYLPNRSPPNSVWRQIYAQRGDETAEQQFAMLYPNNNRSQTGLVTASLTIPASGQAPGVAAQQQSALYGSVVNYDVGSNVGGIACTLTALAAAPNGLAYGINTQCVDTITAGDSSTWPINTNVRLQNEYDFFVHNASTTVRGSLNLLYATVVSANGANLIAYSAGIFSTSTEIWGIGFSSGNGSARVGLQIGNTAYQTAQVPGLSSQPIEFIYTNKSSSASIYGSVAAVPADDGTDGDLLLTATIGKLGIKLENLAHLKAQSATGADLSIAYVNGNNHLTLGENITQTLIGAGGQLGFVTPPIQAANDAAANTAGVPLGGVYRIGNALQVRLV